MTKKKTTTVIVQGKVPPNSRLANSERELLEASQHMFEDFVATGVILMRILDEKEYTDGGYTSFDQYMNERSPLGMKKSHAWRTIRAARIRPKLPKLDSHRGESAQWTVRAVQPLTHKDLTDADVSRVAGEVKKRVKAGEPLNDKLVKEEVDGDLGIIRKREAARRERDKTEARLSFHVKQFLKICKRYRKLFESVTAVQDWEDVDRDSSGLVASVAE